VRGIDEWLTGEDEMVAGVGEGARGGARRRAAHGVRVGGARSRAWPPSGASQEAREEEAWERWPGRGVEEREQREAARACSKGAACARSRGGTRETRRAGTGPPRAAHRVGREERRGELGFAGGELGRTPAQQRAAQQGGEARVATCGHVGSDVAVHVASQRWSEVFWTSSDTLE